MAHEDWGSPDMAGPSTRWRWESLPIEAIINRDEQPSFGELILDRWTWPQIEQAFAIVAEWQRHSERCTGAFDAEPGHEPHIRSVDELITAARAHPAAERRQLPALTPRQTDRAS